MKLLTPFHAKHLEHSAQIVDVGGWQLASVYTRVEEEYWMVRERAGFIDYSFQYTIAVGGKDAFSYLQKVLVNDLRKIHAGKAIYSSLLYENGNIVNDAVVLWLEKDLFIIVGGRNKTEALTWLKQNKGGFEVSIVPVNLGMLCLQGPRSREVLQRKIDLKGLPYFGVTQGCLGGIPLIIARVGFTGELGYELYVYPEYAHELWDTVIELGKEDRVGPYGLAASRPLSVEKGYVSSGDLYEGVSPLELGLQWTVAFDKGDFLGKQALLNRKSEGLKSKWITFEVSNPEVIAMAKDNLLKDGKVVGQVTTNGIYGFTVGKSLGNARVEPQYAEVGQELELEHQGKCTTVAVTSRRLYDPEGKKLKA
jgi:aminomethyltransferase